MTEDRLNEIARDVAEWRGTDAVKLLAVRSLLGVSEELIAALREAREERDDARSTARCYRMALKGDVGVAVVLATTPEPEWLKEDSEG